MTFLAASAALVLIVGLATVWDMRTMRIPDPLNALLIASGLAANWLLERSLWDALIGAAAGYCVIVTANLLYRRLRGRDGIGMGDAKMLAGAGAWVGWMFLPFVLLAASLLGIGYALARGMKRNTHMPFGPFIGAGLVVVWIAAAPTLTAQARLQATMPPTGMTTSASPVALMRNSPLRMMAPSRIGLSGSN